MNRSYGSMIALNALDLTVNQGDLFGFIGSNGAGKTTSLRILATFLAPSAGQALVLGHDSCATPTPFATSSVTCRTSLVCTRTWK